METLGTDFNSTGSVLSRSQLEDRRRRRGECLTCGQKCFQKKVFKLIPITEEGCVLEGRCLKCRPLPTAHCSLTSPVPSVPSSVRATLQDLQRFNRTQSSISNRSANNSRGSSPSSSSGRAHIARTVSDLPRPDKSSPRQQFRRVASAIPPTSSNGTPRSPIPLPLTTTVATSEQFSPPQLPPESAYQVQAQVVDYTLSTERQTNDKQFCSPSPSVENRGANRTSKTLFKSLSTRITGSSRENSNGGTFRSPQRKSLSAQLPTKEELEQAHLTILAAQQHGIYSSSDLLSVKLPDLSHSGSSNELNIQQGNPSSSRDVVAPNSIPQAAPKEIDGYPVPQHGVLDRGGMVPIAPTTNIGGQPYHSNRSIRSNASSVPSVEDASNYHRTNNSRQAASVAQSPDNNHIPQLVGGDVSDNSHLPLPKLTEEESLNSLERAGQNIDLIVQAMRDHSTSYRIATTALERLASWRLSSDDQNHLGRIDAHVVIGDVMHAHQNTRSIHVAAFGALWNMSGTTQNQLAMANSRVLDMILTAMDRFVDSAEMKETAIAILSNLGAVPGNLDILDEKGALVKIVDTMTKFSEVSSIQVKGCGAVSNLASHDGPTKQRLMDCGAGGALVVAMVMHPNDTYLLEKALRALRNLCANSDDNKLEVANIGGIDSVITAMQIHRDVVAVQKEGAWTLSNLATNHTNRDIIGECGGIDVVIRAIWVHSDDVELQEWCCRALFALSLAEQNCEIVLEVGGISAIVNTMHGHVDSATVQEMGCAILGNLAGDDRSRARIVEEEALDAIVLAMVLHSDEIQVQERACTVLMRLAVPSNHYAMIAANIPELVRQAASKFPDRCNEPATQVLNTLEQSLLHLSERRT